MEKNIVEKHNDEAVHLVATAMRYVGTLVFVFVGVASALNIFVINKMVMMHVVIITLISCAIPASLYYLLHLTSTWTIYFNLALVTLYVGFLYSYLSYHVVLIFIFPVLLACLYNKIRYVVFVNLLSFGTIVASHFIAFYLKIVPDEPLITLKGVINYGILPRLIEFGCCSIVCIAIVKRSQKLVKEILDKAYSETRKREILHKVIDESEILFEARTYKEAIYLTVNAMVSTLSIALNLKKEEIICEAGYCLNREERLMYIYHKDRQETWAQKRNISKTEEISSYLCWNSETSDIIFSNKSFCIMQFYLKNNLLGYVKLNLPEQKQDAEFIDLLRICYNNASKVMTNVELNFHMLETQRRLVQSLAMISESKSEQTGQHIKRVGEYMKVMGKELGLSEQFCESLAMAAMLHDVGKMSIPREILDKPGKLTKEEFDVVKTHVTEGYKLLEGCPGEMMELGREIAFQHHEKWDGTGYLGKSKEQINVYATYVAVVDVFDALISKRSYKKAWSTEDAYQEILRLNGTHFSPDAVELFKKVYPEILLITKKYMDEES